METSEKSKYIRIAGIIALTGNAILAVTKLILAYISKSMAVMGDGIDSSTDVLIAIVTLIISGIISKPCDKEHPWGHERAETTATMVLAFIIFIAGGEFLITSVKKLISKSYTSDISFIAISAALISICGKTILAVSQFILAKKSESQMIKANAKNMFSDIIMSAAILIGLSLSKILKLPVLDPIIAILTGLWVIKNAVMIFIEQNTELMDGISDHEIYSRLFEAVNTVPEVSNPHSARIRKMASHLDIDLDIEVDPVITIFEAHELSEQVEDAIRKALPEAYTVMIHIEPKNSCFHQPVEAFGLNPSNLKEQ